MVAILDTGDYIVRTLNIKDIKSELLDEFGMTEIDIEFTENTDEITRCRYVGYKGNEILDIIKKNGTLNIDTESWQVYRRLSIDVEYNSYKDMKEYYEVNKLIKKKKNVDHKSDKEQWDALERLDEE